MTELNKGNHLINVPDIGEGIAEVEIVEWPVSIGDDVREDDVICVVMTDKATVEIPSPVDGQIVWLALEPGETIAVGAELIGIKTAGSIDTENDNKQIKSEPEATDNTTNQQSEGPIKTTSAEKVETVINPPAKKSTSVKKIKFSRPGIPRREGDKPIASPAVRKRARNAGIDLAFVKGTANADRITHEDLDTFISEHSQGIESISTSNSMNTRVDEIKVIGLRRKIATVMQDTKQRIPHFTYVEEVDVTELESLRSKLNNERTETQPKLTVLPFIMKAIVKAIKIHPEMSSRFDDQNDIVHQYGAAHIGMATQTDNGLVVPVLKHCEALDIWQSASEIKRLASAAREGTASRDELTGSTITITSLGPLGGLVTTPVINSPEVAIIGINKIIKRPLWQDGAFIPRDMMNLSSSFDHRIIDGWEATLFIQEIKKLLETPAMLFMEI